MKEIKDFDLVLCGCNVFLREVPPHPEFRRDVPPPHPEIISKMIVVIIILLLLTFNLPGPSFFFTYQHSQKKNEKPKYTLKTRKYNLTLQFQASVSH